VLVAAISCAQIDWRAVEKIIGFFLGICQQIQGRKSMKDNRSFYMVGGDLKLFESASQFLLGNGFVALLYKIAGATKRKQKSKEKYIYFLDSLWLCSVL
jgi:hypothetical protein